MSHMSFSTPSSLLWANGTYVGVSQRIWGESSSSADMGQGVGQCWPENIGAMIGKGSKQVARDLLPRLAKATVAWCCMSDQRGPPTQRGVSRGKLPRKEQVTSHTDMRVETTFWPVVESFSSIVSLVSGHILRGIYCSVDYFQRSSTFYRAV